MADDIQPAPMMAETKDPASFVHEHVYSRLRDALMAGELVPGRAISVRRLAAEFDVSAMPAREAIRRLVAVGALELTPTRRVKVASMTDAKLSEISAARVALEPLLAGMAADNLPSRERNKLARELEKIDTELDEAIRVGDVPGYARLNRAFHFRLYEASGSEVMIGLVESLWLQFGPFMRQVIGRLGTSSLVDDKHKVVIDGLRDGDKERVAEAVQADICQGLETIDMGPVES